MRARTRAHHDAAEAAVAPQRLPHQYGPYLAAMRAVHAAMEPMLQRFGWPVVKLDWIDADLRHLGLAPPGPARCRPPHDAASAAGCAYVLEGASLGARVLYREWAAPLGYGKEAGARFLFGEGEHTGRRWAAFVQRLDAQGFEAAQVDACVAAAQATFEAIVQAYRAAEAAALTPSQAPFASPA